MKNVVYYLVLTILWAMILIFLGLILVAIGGIDAPHYAFVIAILQPRLWLISTGATMLLRPMVYKNIFGVHKSFSKSIATVIIILGVIITILALII